MVDAAYTFAGCIIGVLIAIIVIGHYASLHRPRVKTVELIQLPRAAWKPNRRR